ncbi:LLM class flavin-dependent oxidoreductase [Nocardioides lianchengensis]|uniref:Flavin-dependent oxidoreductase, luciferase family (Includes alkanesulfonate monooxygenase SsuD and methylene tetrahydromethanopterin reductase) n=1 Tax=Nocardioides lianchengensis TaxID=1045774 RepID=A0A1G6UMT7_9ACTN|nr:LLM class flavin-dependent oxidoreductase [Nocardioides lianchengensis]NYG10980.1 alkanesulfonate monooxygenase SsuD/methylene tetrahydromethanopterin reductase-like flavin-dependent oxidoreductase (luciferase family) [Nocardioides lianchengensis]SDD42574.1 Flavin-dependent oxidoreductase, luciferase family (includes alkanesulfonate monooxygenase SsuD and methylene tetrahydromethanopterin reductase) [Nocardioides lianchengensis]
MTQQLHLAVALDGAGWHPAAWREDDARPTELLRAPYWADLVREAEAGLLDLVTIEDSLAIQTESYSGYDDRTDRVRGRLDAVLIAARVAPLTRYVGLVPTVVATHTEPFHVSKAIATLDHVSGGRAGVRVQASGRAHENRLVGRRELPGTDDLLDEVADHVEVQRRLWDSWEDGAEIRDVATGRFIDRERLHYADFEGRWFSVRGPSITPRPPQGQPLVVVLAHEVRPVRIAARAADVVLVTPHSGEDARSEVERVREVEAAVGRAEPLLVLGELLVVLGDTEAEAADRLARLDERAGGPLSSDAEVFVGTATSLADLLQARAEAGLAGFRLRPATLPGDLRRITRDLVPELQRRSAFRTSYDGGGLRERLGLARPDNRYAPTGARR